MGYKSAVQSGKYIELYEYEGDVSQNRKPRESKYIVVGEWGPPYSFGKPRGTFKYVKRLRKGWSQRTRVRTQYSANRAKKNFLRLVQANLAFGVPNMLTLTFSDVVGITAGYRALTRFIPRFARMVGSEIRYVAVPEFQERGSVHFHLLIWAEVGELSCVVSKDWYVDSSGKRKRKHGCSETRQCERNTRRISSAWGNGFVDFYETDGSVALAYYMAKYMSKAMSSSLLFGAKAFSSSRRLVRPMHYKTDAEVDWLTEGTLDVDNSVELLIKREYSTPWLGKCTYSRYKLSK